MEKELLNHDLFNELFCAWHKLNNRGLLHASKFIAELLISVKPVSPVLPPIITDTTYLLAKNYFDIKEYYRAAHCLEEKTDVDSIFLKNYARYLAGEKTKGEEIIEVGERCPVKNRLLVNIKEELANLYELNLLDGFGLYIYGVVLREMSYIGNARNILVESLVLEPCNWSGWLDLAVLCPERDILDQLDLPKNHWMYQFFVAHINLELNYAQEAMATYEKLDQQFPNNTYILAQIAQTSYTLQDFEKSEELFDKLTTQDPFRITGMDTYSNVLYVSEKHAKLSYLAYKASSTDKYTPEANVIIGNYYSLKSDHAKAVKYFQRALALNPKYLPAWTLMGHEYIEMKLPNSAIPAYRKAVDVNPRDYRAWFGLGMSYEIYGMPLYALYYYGKACALRPNDTAMWCAMAECYESNDNMEEAIKCLKRAECNPDKGLALVKLAKIYKKIGQIDNAAFYFKKNLDYRESENIEIDQDQIEGIQFLAQYCKDSGDYEHATIYCNKLLDFESHLEEAKSLLKEISSSHKPNIQLSPIQKQQRK